MSESDTGEVHENGEVKFRDAYQAYLKRLAKIHEEHVRSHPRVGRKGDYQGQGSWTPREKRWVEKAKARLNELAETGNLTPERRKEIENGVRREME